jgi:transcriptional regulator with XRE-family HTH domain
VPTTPSPLHRLLFLHHRSAREAAETLGVSENTVSRWLNGKRKPSYDALMQISRAYGINPGLLAADREKSPETYVAFLKELGDPERIDRADTELIPAVLAELHTQLTGAKGAKRSKLKAV